MNDEMVNAVSQRYIELYEKISGLKFQPADFANLEQSIEQNVLKFLGQKASV
jgi:phosphoribosylaminoimidazole-succinocarboxamide synthase